MPEKAPEKAIPQHRRKFLLLVILLVVGVGAFFIWRGFFAARRVPENLVIVSGRIEGDDSAVASKITGRIREIRVREGDMVKAGDTIAVLEDEQLQAREEQARSALAGAEARTRAAQSQVAVLEQQLQQDKLQTEQAKIDAEGRVKQASASVDAAESDLAQQEAANKLAQFNKNAYDQLVKTGAASELQSRQATAAADQQAAAVAAAQRRREAARGALTTAQANLSNPAIRESQSAIVRKQIQQQEAEIANTEASTAQARSQVSEAEQNRGDLTIVAPFDGTVVTRVAEPGEVIAAGTAIVTLLDLRKVYLRGFVPEGQIGKIKIGQAAHVYLDSDPSKAIDAEVLRIDPEATFTPENTYFRDDRVKQVVGVKLQLKGAEGFAKPGMPADGEILLEGAWPARRYTP